MRASQPKEEPRGKNYATRTRSRSMPGLWQRIQNGHLHALFFLNYNYKMYAKTENQHVMSHAAAETLNPMQREENEYWTRERERMDEPEDEDDRQQSFSFSSIFSRLPSFE